MNSSNGGINLKAALLVTGTDVMVALSLMIPIMGNIAKALPKVPMSTLVMLLTVPGLTMILGVLIAGWGSDYVSKKTILMIGTLIFGIAGAVTAVYDNITYMLVMRAVLGFGGGILSSMVPAMIAQFYEGRERAAMMGQSLGIGAAFSIIANLAAGALGTINWHLVFYCYLFYVLLTIWQFVTIPNVPPERKDPSMQLGSKRLNTKALGLYVHVFIFFLLMSVFATLIAMFIMNEKLGNSLNAAYASSLCVLGNFIISTFLFPALYSSLKRYIYAVAFAVLGVSFVFFAGAHSMLSVYVGAVLVGMGTALFQPASLTDMTRLVDRAAQTFAVSVVFMVISLGQFAVSYYITGVGGIFNPGMRTIFTVTVVLCLVFAVLAVFYVVMTRKQSMRPLDPGDTTA